MSAARSCAKKADHFAAALLLLLALVLGPSLSRLLFSRVTAFASELFRSAASLAPPATPWQTGATLLLKVVAAGFALTLLISVTVAWLFWRFPGWARAALPAAWALRIAMALWLGHAVGMLWR